MYQALYRKWRSKTFDQVVGQDHVTQTLKRQVATGRLSHAYLFTGTRGTGKTSCAKLLARAVNCENPQDGNPCNACPACQGILNGSILDVLELDAASNNGVDDIRAILDEAVYTPATVKKRVYIIDEVHMLSNQAFNALLQILEEPPEHLMFILATTEVHKVLATIKSRCQQFAFKRIHPSQIAAHLLHISQEEGIGLTDGGAALIARLADGGMRDALSLLDQCAGGGGEVDESRVLSCLGLAGNLEAAALLENAADGDLAAALERLDGLYANGKEMTALAGELSALVRDLLVRKTAPKTGAALMTGGFDGETLKKLSARFDTARLAQMLNRLQRTAADLARSANRRTDMELCLAALCDPALDPSPAGLAARVARLEQGGAVPVPEGRQGAVPERTPPPAPRREPPSQEKAVPWEEPPLREEVPWEEPPLPEEPPPRDLDAPPWDEPEPAPRARPPKTEPSPRPEPEAVPESPPPAEESPAPAADAPGWPGWPAFRDQLKGILPVSDYSFISSSAMAEGRFDGKRLTLWVANEFLQQQLSRPDIARPMARLCQTLTGAAQPVDVRVGQAPPEDAPPPAAGAVDPLEAFLGQGGSNIIVE